MENGTMISNVLVTLDGGRLHRLTVGLGKVQVPWAAGVLASSVDGVVVLSYRGEGRMQRIASGSVISVGGHRTSCIAARQGNAGVEVCLGPSLVGISDALVRAFHQAACAAGVLDPVLVLGESGTGKDLVARAIHDLGAMSGGFVALNLAAVPRELAEAELFGWVRGAFTGAAIARAGAFESALGGTLFLDEVAEAPLSVQAKLLRAVEDGTVTRLGTNRPLVHRARVVAATHQDPSSAIAGGVLRLDLLQRLACLVIRIPPLRDRPEDIPAIARSLCRGQMSREGLAKSVIDVLSMHDWPGNVRELRNVLRRAEMMSGDGPLRAEAVREALDDGRLGLAVVSQAEGGESRADRRRQIAESGLPRSTFYYRLKRGRIPAGQPSYVGVADTESAWPSVRPIGRAG